MTLNRQYRRKTGNTYTAKTTILLKAFIIDIK